MPVANTFSVLCVFHCVNVPDKRLHVERDAKVDINA
jgi:hypothetical protein